MEFSLGRFHLFLLLTIKLTFLKFKIPGLAQHLREGAGPDLLENSPKILSFIKSQKYKQKVSRIKKIKLKYE